MPRKERETTPSSPAEQIPTFPEFQFELSRRVQLKLPQLQEEERGRLWNEVLTQAWSFLPRYVVEPIVPIPDILENQPRVVAYIGRIGDRVLFYDKGRSHSLLSAEQIVPNQAPKVKTLLYSDLTGQEQEEILATLAEKSRQRPKEITIPPGHFLIRYQAQWATGGHEGEPSIRTGIYKAKRPGEALEELRHRLMCATDDYFFSDFRLRGADDSGWREVKVSIPTPRGIEPASHVNSITLAKAGFVF